MLRAVNPKAQDHSTLDAVAMARLSTADLAVIASVDCDGHPWAWPFAGSPGMVRPLGPELLRVRSRSELPIELCWQLLEAPQVGLVALDLARGVSVHVNGQAAMIDGSLTLAVERAFVSRPAYLTARQGMPATPAAPQVVQCGRCLDARQMSEIGRADTLFIATRDADGRLDASHRGGPPGFIDATLASLSFSAPAESLAEDARACLLLIDFETGRWLQVLAVGGGSESRARFHVARVLEGSGLERSWRVIDPSGPPAP